MKTPKMIGKAVCVFPNNLPFKEYIGTRGNHQITITNATYNCAYFAEEPVYENSDGSIRAGLIYENFISDIGAA